jgi:hypothetical protein
VSRGPEAKQPTEAWREDARYFPDATQVLAAVEVDTFLKSSAGQAVVQQITALGQRARSTFARVAQGTSGKPVALPPMPAPQEFLAQEVRKEIGLEVSDLRHLTLAKAEGESRPVVVLRTGTKVKAADILKHIHPNDFHAKRVGNHTLYEGAKHAFMLPEDRTVVFGSASLLRAILKRNGAASLSPALREAIAQADFSRPVSVATTKLDGWTWLGASPLPQAGGFAFDFSDGVKISFRAKFKDASAAAKFKTTLDQKIAAGRQLPGTSPMVAKLLGNLRTTVSGGQLTLSTSADPKAVLEAIVQLGTSAQRTFKHVGNAVGSTSADPRFKYVGSPTAGNGGKKPFTIKDIPTKVGPGRDKP